jgi:hypothetical protein
MIKKQKLKKNFNFIIAIPSPFNNHKKKIHKKKVSKR